MLKISIESNFECFKFIIKLWLKDIWFVLNNTKNFIFPLMYWRCSGHSNCKFNLKKDHIPVCIGEDGSVKIKYTCIAGELFFVIKFLFN
jgi:hypothetical protein